MFARFNILFARLGVACCVCLTTCAHIGVHARDISSQKIALSGEVSFDTTCLYLTFYVDGYDQRWESSFLEVYVAGENTNSVVHSRTGGENGRLRSAGFLGKCAINHIIVQEK